MLPSLLQGLRTRQAPTGRPIASGLPSPATLSKHSQPSAGTQDAPGAHGPPHSLRLPNTATLSRDSHAVDSDIVHWKTNTKHRKETTPNVHSHHVLGSSP